MRRRFTVSIHVPARGTTRRNGRSNRKEKVSIHVPARGTTGRDRGRASSDCGFNPRSRTGNDSERSGRREGRRVFQSTFPHGERLDFGSVDPPCILFQSTFPHGERLTRPVFLFPLGSVSIHVPARGTTTSEGGDRMIRKFQSTFPHGERLKEKYGGRR